MVRSRAEAVADRLTHLPSLILGKPSAYPRLTAVAIMVSAAVSPIMVPSRADYNFPVDAEGANLEIVWEATSMSPVTRADVVAIPAAVTGPSKVIISGTGYAYSYVVNGRIERLRGIGYNPMYSHLSSDERASRYDWDFSEMKAAGVNTILGWEREQFDELTLQKAQEYGIGVILPYHLPGYADYGNPDYEDSVQRDVMDWLARFKDYPAVRMWGIGNEVIHYINNPEAPKAKAFAKFYVKLADAVHAADPDHPVIYRDAEDMYVTPLRDALQNDGARRPWFVYGVNFFTNRICEALPDWPSKGMDVPLVVSEFAPSGLGRDDRPKGYLHMLRCITGQYPSVLGAFVYVWSTSGPEAIDRTMGLVDSEGHPVDRSFWAIGRAFKHQDNSQVPVGISP